VDDAAPAVDPVEKPALGVPDRAFTDEGVDVGGDFDGLDA